MNPQPQSAKTVVEIENLVSHYGDRRILDGVDLVVRKGEIMAIMGGSGAGKSTLLRNMLGLNRPSFGRIRIFGQDITRLKRSDLLNLRRKIGVAFQGGALLTSISVGGNIELPLREHTKLNNETIGIITRLKLEMVNLAGCEGMMPSELSGGMLKRAALARAVVMDPRLMILDEPSSGLDPITAVEIDELILRMKCAMNLTMVIITHELQSALKIADRIAVLSHGKVIFTGTKDQIRESDNEYIQNLLNRTSANNRIDGDEYLRRLTGVP